MQVAKFDTYMLETCPACGYQCRVNLDGTPLFGQPAFIQSSLSVAYNIGATSDVEDKCIYICPSCGTLQVQAPKAD